MRVDLSLNPKQFDLDSVLAIQPRLADLLRQYGVQSAYILGSVLDRTNSSLSDLDIAILPPENLQNWLDYTNQLHSELCQLLQADNVDLILLDRAPLSLQVRAVSFGRQILSSRTTAEFEERILARHADLGNWRQENWKVTRDLVRQGVTANINMIDRNRVERFVLLLRDALSELHALNLESIGLEAYLQDKRTRALSEHYLRIALEATLDLGRHVIIKTGLGVPQEYRDVGRILAQREIVSTQLGQELEAMAGMRDVLVHLYWDIDYSLLYQTVVERRSAFEKYLNQIFDYIDQLEERTSQ